MSYIGKYVATEDGESFDADDYQEYRADENTRMAVVCPECLKLCRWNAAGEYSELPNIMWGCPDNHVVGGTYKTFAEKPIWREVGK